MTYISYDPFLKTENSRFNLLKDDELKNIIENVHEIWFSWSASTLLGRKESLQKLGDIIIREKEMHARFIVSEMGKPVSQALSEVEKCASLCFYYADNLGDFSKPDKRISSASQSLVFYEPQGIILGIMPWNFPYWQAMRFIIPCIAAGNTVLLKHASNVPVCAQNIELLFNKAGFPDYLVKNIFVSYDQIERIISLPEIRGVSLTGSTSAGRKIAGMAGKYLKKTVLELGGSDPFIVLKDADLEAAAAAAVYSRFQNCGQSCIAAKRLYVESPVYNDFLEIFSDKVRDIKCGDPYDPATFIGPMVNETALSEIEDQVARAVGEGARLVLGGKCFSDDSLIFSPTIITDVPDNSILVCDEIFGPVIPVMEFFDIEELIAKANNSDFGLGSSVWTSDMDKALSIARRLDSGTVAVNGFVRSDPAVPFGGVKDSGFGRELSIEGFREFLNIKTVSFY